MSQQRLAAVVLLLWCAGPAGGEEPADELERKLDAGVRALHPRGFWGAVLVARGGKPILHRAYGFADYAQRPNTTGTLFEIASTSKQFTCAAIARLQMQGKLRARDTLDRFFKDVPATFQGVTLHHLMSHTSGFDNDDMIVPYNSPLTRDAFVRHCLAARPRAKPGERWDYNNGAYALLAAVVEVASGQTFEDYSREHLFRPAGMTDTGFVRDAQLDRARAAARRSGGATTGTALEWHWGFGYRGMGGVVTTAADLLKWARALAGTTVLDDEAKKLLWTPVKNDYGCGWMIGRTGRGTRRIHHGGGVAGFRCAFVLLPDDDAVIVVLTNEEGRFHDLGQRLEETLFPSRLRLELRLEGSSMNPHGAVILKSGAALRARKEAGQVVLEVREEQGDRLRAALSLSPAQAQGVRKRLAEVVAAKERAAGEKVPAGLEAGFYTGKYKLGADRRLALDSNLTVAVNDRYVHSEGEDLRVMLVVQDSQAGQWPLLLLMDLPWARRLVQQLEAAAR